MKIAVASDNGMVSQHFGHCEGFMIFEAENDRIIRNIAVPNPGHKPGFLPNFLKDMGVNVVISGGMGSGAIDLFKQYHIEVIVGADGSSEVAATRYLKGELKSTDSVCEHHHHGGCGH